MKFGYFTLSDNRYEKNTRSPEALVNEIYQQSLLADRLGFHSAWIGEHHFNLLGVNPCPNILLAQLAGATKRIRLPGQLLCCSPCIIHFMSPRSGQRSIFFLAVGSISQPAANSIARNTRLLELTFTTLRTFLQREWK